MWGEGVEVRVLCMPVNSFHTKQGKPFFNGLDLGHKGHCSKVGSTRSLLSVVSSRSVKISLNCSYGALAKITTPEEKYTKVN